MSCFGCIYFGEDTILLSKVSIKPMHCFGANAYEVIVQKKLENMRQKDWLMLERKLEQYFIEYVVMDIEENPFQNIHLVDGQEVRDYLASELLVYIYKYKMIEPSKLYAKVGVIVGKVNQSLNVIASLLDSVTDLTLFVQEPDLYKDILEEIYSKTRLKAKAKVPYSTHLYDMDIVFDIAGNHHYAKWCQPTAIYIDYKNYVGRKKLKFTNPPPIIWYDFNIRCGRQICDVKMLQGAMYAQGIYKTNYLNEFKRMEVSVDTVYSTCIS